MTDLHDETKWLTLDDRKFQIERVAALLNLALKIINTSLNEDDDEDDYDHYLNCAKGCAIEALFNSAKSHMHAFSDEMRLVIQ